MVKLPIPLLSSARAALLRLGDRRGKRVLPCKSGTADALGSPHLLLATHIPLGRVKIFQMCGVAHNGLKMVSNPSCKLGAPTTSPLSGAPALGACSLPFPFSSPSLSLLPRYPLGKLPTLGKSQSLGPSTPAGGGGRALALAGGTGCACFLSPCTAVRQDGEAAGQVYSLSFSAI